MKEIKLSVVIPVYNVEKYVRDCVESLYRQGLSEEEFEVILINDGSTDGSLSVLRELEEAHRNIRVMNQANQGPSVARNQGILAARGEYIHFMDSDDLLLDNSLCHMLKTAMDNQLDILKANYVKTGNQEIGKGIEIPNHVPTTHNIKTGEQGFIDDNNPMYCYVWIHLFRRKFLLENHLLFLIEKYFEDVAFTTESYLKAKRFMAIPYVFYIYRQHNTSIMATMNVKKLYSMNDIIAYNYQLQYRIPLSSAALKKLYYSLYASLIVNLWYVSHHRSLYSHRMEVINDLKGKVAGLSFNGSLKQRIVTFCYQYIPDLYIRIRYLLARKKYN